MKDYTTEYETELETDDGETVEVFVSGGYCFGTGECWVEFIDENGEEINVDCITRQCYLDDIEESAGEYGREEAYLERHGI